MKNKKKGAGVKLLMDIKKKQAESGRRLLDSIDVLRKTQSHSTDQRSALDSMTKKKPGK